MSLLWFGRGTDVLAESFRLSAQFVHPARPADQAVAGSSRSTSTGKWSLARRASGVSTTS